MKRILATACLAATALAALTAMPARAADVGVSIGISQPGVYGRVDIGRFPQPVLVAPSPVYMSRGPVVAAPEPVYLWVPEAHRRHWRSYCGRYNACGAPVYFVQDRWYRQNVWTPPPGHYRHGGPPGRAPDWDRDRGHDRGHDRGNGHGRDDHGHGHDR